MPLIAPSGSDPISTLIEEAALAQQLPGAAWRVERSATVLSEGAVGLACREPEPVRAALTTPYDLASLTKPLATALIALGLHVEGALDLEAPVATWVGELARSPYGAVSLLDLGRHRGGFPAWKPLYLEAKDLEGMLAALACTPPAVPRGTTVYSDLGYIALGAAVERAAGDSLAQLFETRIARPLALPRIGFANLPSDFPDAAATERGNEYERARVGPPGDSFAWRTSIPRGEVHDGNAHALSGVAGHAGLFGTVAEVAAMGRAMLAGQGIVASDVASKLLLRAEEGQAGRTFGLCPAVESGAARGVLPDSAPGHTGFTGTSLWLVPEENLVLVLLTNRVHPVVRDIDFQPLRLEFHRRALELAHRC